MPLSTLIKVIQDIMRKDVGVDGDAQRISQMVWLLFLKIFDDREKEWKVTVKNYKSPLPSRFQWSNWAANPEGETGEDLIGFVNNDLFPALKKLAITAGVEPIGKVVGSVFEDAYNYMKSGTLLRQVINTIQIDVDFNSSSDRHLFNDIYEKILSDLQSAGNAGEYYTPRAVTQFMVDILNPQLGESILDPACGTGGFLVNTIEHLKRQVKNPKDSEVLQYSIHGVEKKPLPHMLAMTNMMLHGIEVPTNIKHDNTLSRPLKNYGPKDRVDCIITNPPFGGMEEDGIEQNFPKKYQTRETADLFMALIMFLLKNDTGRAAIVLPDGFLFGEGVKTTIKKELLEEFNLHTIVRLPNGVFSPYTGIKTNLLFFEKGLPTKQVWFFEHPYPEGYKSYSRSKPLTIKEFDLEKKWWKNRKQNEYAWKVTAKEIEERNYNLDFKNPHVVDIKHGDPDVLIMSYRDAIKSTSSVREDIKAELSKSIAAHPLIKYFNELFTTSNNVNQLKSAILQLAVSGKLVPQDPNDLPASELLKEIESEKKRLVKDGRIRKQESLLLINPEEIPYKVPKGWEWVRFGSIAQHNSGKTLDSGRNIGQLRDYITTSNLYWGFFKLENVRQMPIRDEELEKCTARMGDLLICEGGEAGRAAVWCFKKEICFQNHIHRARLFCHIEPFYIYRFFEKLNATGEINSYRKGVGISNMSSKSLASIAIPLPPLAEQRRIVAKIDQLMSLCNTLVLEHMNSTEKQTAILDAVLAKL
jgi:type I restriction enzyme M protein